MVARTGTRICAHAHVSYACTCLYVSINNSQQYYLCYAHRFWLRTATGLKSKCVDPGVTRRISAAAGEAFAERVRVYAMKNIATINIYLPRIQDKHTEELENLCRASAANMAGINLMFSFAGWWKQKYINIVCRCASRIELWENINASRHSARML